MTRDRRRLGKIKKWLFLNFPGEFPIRLTVGKMPKDSEDLVGAYFPPEDKEWGTILVSNEQTQTEKINTFLHEWAHYRIDPWSEKASSSIHGGHTNEFYLEYGRIERAYFVALGNELKLRN